MKLNRRIYCVALSLLLSSINLIAQVKESSIIINYDDNSVGRNVNVTFQRKADRNTFIYAGLKYNLNSSNFRNDYTTYTPYFKEFRTKKFSQKIGVKAGINKVIYSINNKFSLLAFGDLQFTSAEAMHGSVQDIYKDTPALNSIVYAPIRSLESSFGLGTKIVLTQKLFFRLQAGIGFNYYWSPNINSAALALSGNRRMPLPINRLFSAGLEYTIDNQKEKRTLYSKGEAEKHLLSISYNNVQVGRNYSITYNRLISSNTYIYGGLKFNLNSKAFVDYTRVNESYYFKQMEANNFLQHIGLKMGLDHQIPIANTNFSWLFFFNLDVSNSDIKNLAHLTNFYAGITRNSLIKNRPINDLDAIPVYRICKNVTSLESTFGSGIRMGLTERTNMRIQAGIGINYYIRPDYYEPYSITYGGQKIEYTQVKFDAPKTELSKMFSLGIDYNL